MRTIVINPALNGFIVQVGCTTIVFKSIDMLCSELKRYHQDPKGVEKQYQVNAINPDLLLPSERIVKAEPRNYIEKEVAPRLNIPSDEMEML